MLLPRPVVTCPAEPPSCVVTTTVRRSSGTLLGRGRGTILPDATAQVRFRLTAGGFAELTRRRRLKATVRIAAEHGGRSVERLVAVTLKIASGVARRPTTGRSTGGPL